ncbi:MAG: hypothetical protein IPN21_18625 [Burkholderiales bacterium]|nr:hypothetical protein [Burkholderiales bacterium]
MALPDAGWCAEVALARVGRRCWRCRPAVARPSGSGAWVVAVLAAWRRWRCPRRHGFLLASACLAGFGVDAALLPASGGGAWRHGIAIAVPDTVWAARCAAVASSFARQLSD